MKRGRRRAQIALRVLRQVAVAPRRLAAARGGLVVVECERRAAVEEVGLRGGPVVHRVEDERARALPATDKRRVKLHKAIQCLALACVLTGLFIAIYVLGSPAELWSTGAPHKLTGALVVIVFVPFQYVLALLRPHPAAPGVPPALARIGASCAPDSLSAARRGSGERKAPRTTGSEAKRYGCKGTHAICTPYKP